MADSELPPNGRLHAESYGGPRLIALPFPPNVAAQDTQRVQAFGGYSLSRLSRSDVA
ncbi:hypothetical protein SBA3_690037 [Candidatus Sulfopaludibacter sp. SbA3]|nr:hypothetical protein SBA3_690037 [Candidatus Sulfopaludibacter sp. SbA3]